MPMYYRQLKTKKALKELQAKTGLPYLEEFQAFMKYRVSRPVWNKKRRNKSRKQYNLPDEMAVNNFYITYVKGRKDHLWAGILMPYEDTFVQIDVLLTYKELFTILEASRYYSFASDIFHAIDFYMQELGEFEQFIIRAKKEIGKNMEVPYYELKVRPYIGPKRRGMNGIYYESVEFVL